MAFVHGKNSYLTVNSINLTGYVVSVDLERKVDMAESTTMGNSSKTYVGGLSDASLSLSGNWDGGTASSGPDTALSSLVGSTAVAFEYAPEGTATGKIKYSGSALLTSYKKTSPVGDIVSFSADFQVSGAVTRAVY